MRTALAALTHERAMMKRETTHPDASGYDCEGYGLTTGIHRYLGTRRHFRPRIDLPVTVEERDIVTRMVQAESRNDAQVEACFLRLPATADRPWGGHEIVATSHEESRCTRCGAHFCEPDVD